MYRVFFTIYFLLPKNTEPFLVPPVSPFANENNHFPLILKTQLTVDGLTVTSSTHSSSVEQQTLRTLSTHRPKRPLPETPEELEAALRRWNVIPDVILKTPPSPLKVEYMYSKVRYGNLLPPFLVASEPQFLNWTIELGSLYALIMVDPDMPKPTAPTEKDFRHWIVGNIPGTHVHDGDTVSEYVGGGLALLGQGMHRYVFLVYKQPGPFKIKYPKFSAVIKDEEADIPEDVQHEMTQNHTKFATSEFVKRYKLGDPVAANYFRIAWGRG